MIKIDWKILPEADTIANNAMLYYGMHTFTFIYTAFNNEQSPQSGLIARVLSKEQKNGSM